MKIQHGPATVSVRPAERDGEPPLKPLSRVTNQRNALAGHNLALALVRRDGKAGGD